MGSLATTAAANSLAQTIQNIMSTTAGQYIDFIKLFSVSDNNNNVHLY